MARLSQLQPGGASSERTSVLSTKLDYHNGRRSFPEVDRFMEKLLSYDESHYHAPDAHRPRMVPITKWVKPSGDTPIFPGGSGVRGPRFPHRGVMLLMQDFDEITRYLRAVEVGYNPQQDITSIRASEILAEAGVDLDACFFTNRFVGVRDADDQYGPNPGWRSPNSKKQHKPYVAMSDEMLCMQLAEQQPRLVLTYGVHVPLSLGFKTIWREKLIERASIMGHSTTIAALVHPSFRQSNVGKVSYRGLTGHAAEIRLIKDALAVAGF